MKIQLERIGSRAIVYDADRIQQPGVHLFDPSWWQQNGRVTGKATGRGEALLLDGGLGPAVLRSYLRGGWAARFSRDQYLYAGLSNSRPVREVRVLAELTRRALPVPRPLAGLCDRSGIVYRGALLMQRITSAAPLADLLEQLPAGHVTWVAVGRCIRRFHDAGVVHADLNARNILVQAETSIYLIDFDRARIGRHVPRLFKANLDRLARSLTKYWPARVPDPFDACWKMVLRGYNVV